MITILALRALLPGFLSYLASLVVHANLSVSTRVYDVGGGAMGPRGTRAYGLRPRLWLLINSPFYNSRRHIGMVSSQTR